MTVKNSIYTPHASSQLNPQRKLSKDKRDIWAIRSCPLPSHFDLVTNMSTFGTQARKCASAKSSKKSSYSSASSSSHTLVATPDTNAKHQGTIPVMSKVDMHKFDRYGEPASTLPAQNKKQEVEKRSNTLPVPIQCAANARIYLRSQTK